MNEVVLRGRLVAAPRLQHLSDEQSTHVCSILLAVDRDFPNNLGDYETDLIDCRIWDEYGTKKAGSCNRGDLVELVGALRVDQGEAGSGCHSLTYVRVDFIRRVSKAASVHGSE